jgi:hypothetical protein
MSIHTLPVFFAPFRHLRHTPPGQGRAGAIFNRCAKRLLPLTHRALVLALTGGVGLPLPELGFDTPFSLRQCLADLAILAVRPAPPQSSPVVAWFHRA